MLRKVPAKVPNTMCESTFSGQFNYDPRIFLICEMSIMLKVKEALNILLLKKKLTPNLGLPPFNDALEGYTNIMVLAPKVGKTIKFIQLTFDDSVVKGPTKELEHNSFVKLNLVHNHQN